MFEYIFASEEYPEFIGLYNDTVAIFVDGANIAHVPYSALHVSVNTINGGWLQGEKPVTNPLYYVDNHDPYSWYSAVPPWDSDAPVYDIQYDGTTVLLTAQATLSANVSYHIKIAIADANDQRYDSGVFIKALIPCP